MQLNLPAFEVTTVGAVSCINKIIMIIPILSYQQ